MILSIEKQIENQIPFEDFKNKWCEKYNSTDLYKNCPDYSELFWAITFHSKEDELVDFVNKNFKSLEQEEIAKIITDLYLENHNITSFGDGYEKALEDFTKRYETYLENKNNL